MNADIFTKKEELHSDLIQYVDNDSRLPMFRSPLMIMVPYSQAFNALINHQYFEKKKATQKAFNNKDWSSYIFLHERPFRLQAFIECMNNMSDSEYWELLGDIWIDSEGVYINKSVWIDLFSSKRNGKLFIMNEEERAHLKGLSQSITVYRGYIPRKNKKGLSYTLDRDKAEWFSARFNENGAVLERQVKKYQIVAYFNRRSESEVIILT